MTDFFVSYTAADEAWAEWIAYILEEEGFTVVIQKWDFRPGSNFVLEMQKAASEAERTIIVLSPDYLKSKFAPSEWAAAFAQDPKGSRMVLVPILVRDCKVPGLLQPLVHINLTTAGEAGARELLLNGLKEARAKPIQRPAFPGTPPHAHKPFPGLAERPAQQKATSAYMPAVKRSASDADKRRFTKDAFGKIRSYFQTALRQLADQHDVVEFDMEDGSTNEFTAEVFLSGRSTCRCRIWLGGMHSSDSISFAEGNSHFGGNSCNEILTVEEKGGTLHLSSLMGLSFSRFEGEFNLKELTPERAAAYLWRRFVAALER